MTYATVSQVKAEFKDLKLKDLTSIKTQEVARFLQETDAVINSYLGNRYVTPISGTASIAREEEVTVDVANNAQAYSVTINGSVIIYTSGVAATLTTIRDGLIDAINHSDQLEPVTATSSAADKLKILSDVPGFDFTIATGADLTAVNTVPNLTGDERLDIVRNIEVMIVCARVGSILRVKVALDSKLKQDVTNLDKRKAAIDLLKAYASGTLKLPGADLIDSGSGIASHVNNTSFEPTFKRGEAQW